MNELLSKHSNQMDRKENISWIMKPFTQAFWKLYLAYCSSISTEFWTEQAYIRAISVKKRKLKQLNGKKEFLPIVLPILH